LWIDGGANLLGIWDTSGEIRYLSGLQFGLSVPFLFIPILQSKEFSREEPKLTGSLRNWFDFGLLFALGLFFLLALRSAWGMIFWPVLSFLDAAGIACLATISFSSTIKLLKLCVPPRQGARSVAGLAPFKEESTTTGSLE
jgi:hypothetical protein